MAITMSATLAIQLACSWNSGSVTYYQNLGWTMAASITFSAAEAFKSGSSGASYACNMNTTTNHFSPVFATTGKWIRLKLKQSSTGSASISLQLHRSGTATLSFIWNRTTGIIDVRRGSTGGTLIASAAVGLSRDTQHVIDFNADCLDSGGTAAVYADMSTSALVSFTGDTKNHGSLTGFDQLRIEGSTGDWMGEVIVSNERIIDATSGTPIELFCERRRRNSDVTNSGFSIVGGDASRYITLRREPVQMTNYIGCTAVGHNEGGGLAQLVAVPAAVFFVQTGFYASRDGLITTIKHRMKRGGSTYTSTGQALGGALANVGTEIIYVQDPITSAAWTVSNANSSGLELHCEAA